MRYKGYKIEPSPSDNFPEMVLVTKGKKITKKFINEKKAIAWIEAIAAESLITKGSKKVKNELSSIGLIAENDYAW